MSIFRLAAPRGGTDYEKVPGYVNLLATSLNLGIVLLVIHANIHPTTLAKTVAIWAMGGLLLLWNIYLGSRYGTVTTVFLLGAAYCLPRRADPACPVVGSGRRRLVRPGEVPGVVPRVVYRPVVQPGHNRRADGVRGRSACRPFWEATPSYRRVMSRPAKKSSLRHGRGRPRAGRSALQLRLGGAALVSPCQSRGRSGRRRSTLFMTPTGRSI